MDLEIKFKKIHPDAILPIRKHGNRELNDYEVTSLMKVNEEFQKNQPVGYPFEKDNLGNITNKILGTGDTGYDVFCVEDKIIPAQDSRIVDTGIEVSYITPGFWFKIEARSGLGFKNGIQPHPGIVDNGYRGNLGIKLYNLSHHEYHITKGDRIAQIVFYPVIEPRISWTEEVYESERGAKGFGSSGK